MDPESDSIFDSAVLLYNFALALVGPSAIIDLRLWGCAQCSSKISETPLYRNGVWVCSPQ
jgi:hypothetical protein